MRECSWRLAEKEYLATSPLWKIHASAELCSPRRVGNAQRVAPPHESGSEMCDLPSCGWNVFFACVCVTHHTMLPVCICSEFFLLCLSPEISSFLPCDLQSRASGTRREALQLCTSAGLKDILLDPMPQPQSKLAPFHYSGSWHAILSHHHSCHNLELFSYVQ